MKKQIVTRLDMEQDIQNALKQPREVSEASYRKKRIAIILFPVLLLVFALLFRDIFLKLSPVLIAVLLIAAVIERLLRLRKGKKLCIDDCDIITDVLSHTEHETFRKRERKHHHKTVDNYDLYFESGKSWRIPKKNYRWHAEGPLSDWFIHQNAHRGDVFILVADKTTGEVVMAYDTEFFEYQG